MCHDTLVRSTIHDTLSAFVILLSIFMHTPRPIRTHSRALPHLSALTSVRSRSFPYTAAHSRTLPHMLMNEYRWENDKSPLSLCIVNIWAYVPEYLELSSQFIVRTRYIVKITSNYRVNQNIVLTIFILSKILFHVLPALHAIVNDSVNCHYGHYCWTASAIPSAHIKSLDEIDQLIKPGWFTSAVW